MSISLTKEQEHVEFYKQRNVTLQQIAKKQESIISELKSKISEDDAVIGELEDKAKALTAQIESMQSQMQSQDDCITKAKSEITLLKSDYKDLCRTVNALFAVLAGVMCLSAAVIAILL